MFDVKKIRVSWTIFFGVIFVILRLAFWYVTDRPATYTVVA